jgi:hypothetical protein
MNELLFLLTHRLESVPLSAVASCFFPELKNPLRAARRLTDQLIKDGLVSAPTLMVSEAIQPPFTPLQDFAPGVEGTNFAQTSYRLSRRWDGHRRPETFVLATKKATRRHGGYVGRIRNVDVDHDCALACVYLSLPEREQKRWRNSAWLEERGWNFGGFEPDAILLGRTFRAHVLIEIGGSSYSKSKLERRDRAARAWRRILY